MWDLEKVFYEKRKKKLTILTAFYFSHENGIKIFLKLFIDNCLKGTQNPILLLLLFNTLNLKCQEKYFF